MYLRVSFIVCGLIAQLQKLLVRDVITQQIFQDNFGFKHFYVSSAIVQGTHGHKHQTSLHINILFVLALIVIRKLNKSNLSDNLPNERDKKRFALKQMWKLFKI